MDIPLPEIIRGQNKAQQMGSASTYARRYALCAALGIVTGDDADDDGNGAGNQYLSEEQTKEVARLVDACRGIASFIEPKFWEWCAAKTVSEIKADRYADVVRMLNSKLKG
jgi:hypothetical protein